MSITLPHGQGLMGTELLAKLRWGAFRRACLQALRVSLWNLGCLQLEVDGLRLLRVVFV